MTSQRQLWWPRLVGFLAGLVLLLLRVTLRRTIIGASSREAARAQSPGPLLYAIWHEQQLQAVLLSDEPRMVTIASRSKDGEIITQALAAFSIKVARGSSSRGGALALRQLEHWVEDGYTCAVTVDGPRGPRRRSKTGILALARLTGRPVVPAVAMARSSWRMRSWDQFEVVKPFSRCCLSFSAPIWVGADDDLDALVERVDAGIHQAEQAALRHLGLYLSADER